MQNLIFSQNYWLASRYTFATNDRVGFGIRIAYYGGVDAEYLCYYYKEKFSQSDYSHYGIRPIITLKPNIINLKDETKDGSTAEKAWDLL